ncbi:hypothetical protein L3Q82_018442, partial [Scortum barcoo]
MFIRELPTPLLTHTYLSTYRSVLGVSSVVHQVQALQLLSLLLPEAHRDTLRREIVVFTPGWQGQAAHLAPVVCLIVVADETRRSRVICELDVEVGAVRRCVRAVWRAVEMASSVERLDRYANWKGSREGGRTDLMCFSTSRSKHFMRMGALLVFLRKVVSHQDQNRMSLWNVSMVMAPNLFSCCRHGNKRTVAKQQEEMEEAVDGAHLVRLMITHQDLLWTVPNFLLSQVRQMNQASNQKQLILTKTKRRLLRRKNDKNDRNQITELCEGVIRVHAPLHTKVSMAIQLDRQMRAKDVTARFECDN